jgi:ribosomal protein S25
MARQTQQPLIHKIRSELEARAADLRPLVSELKEIEGALQALPMDGAVTQRASGSNGRRAKTAGTTNRKRTRRTGRPERFLGIVKANPGITMSQVAKRMGVQASSLYRVQRSLTKEGKVKKSGTQLTAV